MTETVRRTRLVDVAYVIVLYGLPALAVIGVVTPLALGMWNFSILGLYLAIPMLLAPVVVRSYRSKPGGRTCFLHRLDWRIPSTLIHVLVGVLAYMTATNPVRPTGFYVGFATIYGLLFLLVASTEPKTASRAIGLYHCCLTLLVSIYSVTLNYDYFIGRTDLPAHVGMMVSMYETGRMPEAWQAYESFPLWHVYTASSYALSGGLVDPHTTMVVLSGLVFAAGVTMMYALTRQVYPNETVAMFSCVVLIAIPDYIFYGMYAISRSIASVLFIVLLFVLVRRSSTRMKALSVVFVLAIVLYHPVTIPFVLVILSILYVVERGFALETFAVDTPVIVVAGGITSIYWLYGAEFLSSYVIDRLVEAIAGLFVDTATAETAPSGVLLAPWREVANYIPQTFLVFFALLGFLFWFERRHVAASMFTAFTAVTVLLIPLMVPGPTLLVDSLADVNVSRFAHYGYMFLALTGGYGLYVLVRRGGFRVFVAVLLLLSCFSFVAVSNDFVASDNPLVERQFYTFYLTEQERESFDRLDEVHQGSLSSDHITCRYYIEVLQSSCSSLAVEDESVLHADHDGILVREGELERRPLQVYGLEYVYADELPWDELNERNRIHDSDAVVYYR